MREYRAWFSFYSEEWGNFDDVAYTVQADNPFDAREKAWPIWNQYIDSKFQSCVKLYAVTWNPDPLNAGDYFYSQAADIKQAVGHIENVDIPNDRIGSRDKTSYNNMQKHYYLGALQTVDDIAQDLYAGKGIVPPSVYEELHYAQELCYELEYGEPFNALQNKIEQAKKWDQHGYLFDIRDLFKHGYISLNGETVLFKEQFGRNGIYPVYNDLDDSEYKYISRWERQIRVNGIKNLQPIDESGVIQNSANHMLYDGQFLLVNPDHFHKDFHTPENMIWTTSEDVMNITGTFTGEFQADNVITGKKALFRRNDFSGVLRPDIVARYNFEDLKAEYAAANHTLVSDMEDTAAEDENEP